MKGTRESPPRLSVKSGPTMTLTPDQYDEMAQSFEKAATDSRVRSEGREEFAKKAKWFHFLAQREREAHRSMESRHPADAISNAPSLDLNSSPQHKRSLAPFLATLWISGAALYFVSTFMFANAINLTGTDAHSPLKEPIKKAPLVIPMESNNSEGQLISQPAPSSARGGSNNAVEQATQVGAPAHEVDGTNSAESNTSQPPASVSRHAIALNEPSYESPDNAVPSSPSPASGPNRTSPNDLIRRVEIGSAQSIEILRATTNAAIRSAPSMTAIKIGRASAGAELQVLARENDWVQLLDPSSGHTGWIESSLVAPASGGEAQNVAHTQAADISPLRKPILGKKKPAAPARVAQRQRLYAELPTDDAFLPPRRRLLSRRRILGEGLMSPGLLPPE